LNPDYDRWHELIPYALFAYRTSFHSSLLETPYYLLFGHDCRLPLEIALTPPTRYLITVDSYKCQLQANLCLAWDSARKAMANAQNQQKFYYDKKSSSKVFSEGEAVLLHNPVVPPHVSKKLHKFWTGPFRIVSVNPPNAKITRIFQPDQVQQNVHFNRLKHFNLGAVSEPCDIVATVPKQTAKTLRIQDDSVKDVVQPVDNVVVDSATPTHRYNLRSRLR
jgi:hypothetical protein